MAERKVVSSRITGRKVIGSANPVAKWGRDSKRTCFDTIGGFFLGLVLFFIPFGLTYCAGTQEKDSKDIAGLDVVAAAEVASFTGKALVAAPTVKALDGLEPPIGEADDRLFAYDYKLEKYETWTETREVTETKEENGQEVEYTREIVEEVSDWKLQEQDKRWSRLEIGSIAIDAQKCDVQLPWERSYFDEYTDVVSGEKWRESVQVVRGVPNMLLAAEFTDGRIADKPDFFILTSKSQAELVAGLNRSEETNRKLLLVLAVVLMFVSFNLIIGPAMLLINLIPIKQLSGAIRFVIGIISLILSIIIVAITYLFVRYWWVIVLLLVGLAIWLVVEANRNRQPDPDLEPAAGED